MRIELPSPSWADAHRAQDDAHTLTLPEQRPLMLHESMLLAGEEGDTVRSEVPLHAMPVLTLTF